MDENRFTPLKAHELGVSDITNIPLKDPFTFVLITDAFSRKIVGHHGSDDMKAYFSVVALNKAIVQKTVQTIVLKLRDKRVQYCRHEYINMLVQNHKIIFITQSGDPLVNTVAVRLNGILKQN